MKKIIFAFLILVCTPALVIVFRAMGNTPTNAQAAVMVQPPTTEYLTPTPWPTITDVPTPTIGYEATLQIAQATADEARRVNADITAQHESNLLSIVQLTAESENRMYQVVQLTALAGPTVVPLTMTQQVVMNTHDAHMQLIAAGELTATYQAPTQMAAFSQLRATEHFAWITHLVDVIGKSALAIFCIALAVFLFRYKPPAPRPAIDPQRETVVHLRRGTGTGTYQQARSVVPCSPEQLTELAEMAVIDHEKKFAINRIETHSRTFKSQRETLIKVREWLIENDFVIRDGDGTITLNLAGEDFFKSWLEARQLPTEYVFEEIKEPETIIEGEAV